jgi:hypothetical protein
MYPIPGFTIGQHSSFTHVQIHPFIQPARSPARPSPGPRHPGRCGGPPARLVAASPCHPRAPGHRGRCVGRGGRAVLHLLRRARAHGEQSLLGPLLDYVCVHVWSVLLSCVLAACDARVRTVSCSAARFLLWLLCMHVLCCVVVKQCSLLTCHSSATAHARHALNPFPPRLQPRAAPALPPAQVRDLKAMGFGETDRVFSPDKLPLADALLPSIQVRVFGVTACACQRGWRGCLRARGQASPAPPP